MVIEANAAETKEKIIRAFPSGMITPPASKSIMHRALICAALTGRPGAESRIENIADSDDIHATRTALRKLFSEDATASIDCKESGSTLRFLIPIAAMTGQKRRFTGEGRLLKRPQDAFARIFESHGASFAQTDSGIEICGPLPSGLYEIEGNSSSQFITGLLFGLSLAKSDSEIRLTTPLESVDYVRLTVEVMRAYGVDVTVLTANDGTHLGYKIKGGQKYEPVQYRVENDWSQAAFFLCSAALGRDVTVRGMNLDSAQGDFRILEILTQMGLEIRSVASSDDVASREIQVLLPDGGMRGITMDCRDIPDIVPPLAAVACFAQGETRFANAGRLRLKESDRLEALQMELSAIGADVRIKGEDLIVRGSCGKPLPGGCADAHNDHRIAMSLAVAAIGCDNPVQLTGWRCVSKSYPNFWTDFEKERRQ